MSIFQRLDWAAVRRHYDGRMTARRNLIALHQSKSVGVFATACLGITDPSANYSAAEHFLGPRVLGANVNAERRVFDLATGFLAR
jgi:hypothetical protein